MTHKAPITCGALWVLTSAVSKPRLPWCPASPIHSSHASDIVPPFHMNTEYAGSEEKTEVCPLRFLSLHRCPGSLYLQHSQSAQVVNR